MDFPLSGEDAENIQFSAQKTSVRRPTCNQPQSLKQPIGPDLLPKCSEGPINFMKQQMDNVFPQSYYSTRKNQKTRYSEAHTRPQSQQPEHQSKDHRSYSRDKKRRSTAKKRLYQEREANQFKKSKDSRKNHRYTNAIKSSATRLVNSFRKSGTRQRANSDPSNRYLSDRHSSNHYSRRHTLSYGGVNVIRQADDVIEINFEDLDEDFQSRPELVDEVMLSLMSTRDHFPHDNKELGTVMKHLEPSYRRKIFLAQLKSRWYAVAIPALIVLILAIILGVHLSSGIPFKDDFRPPSQIYGKVKVLCIEGKNLAEQAKKWDSPSSRKWVKENLHGDLKKFVSSTGFPFESIKVTKLSISEKIENEKDQGRKVTDCKESANLEFVVNPSKKPTDYLGKKEISPAEFMRKFRKEIVQSNKWRIDPKDFSITQGNVTVKASSARNFLKSAIPPLDLKEEDKDRSLIWRPLSNIKCEPLLVPPRSILDPLQCEKAKKHPPKTICTFSCKDGFILRGGKYRVCLSNGVWSGKETECIKPCPNVQPLPNGIISPKKCTDVAYNNTIMPGTRCVYQCNQDYSLVGSLQRVCQDDGSWSFTLPVCQRECPILKPPINGEMGPKSCYDTVSLEGDICTFACDEGMILQGESYTTCDSNGRWTEDVPVCRKICLTLVPVADADVHPDVCSQSILYEGMSCTYTCHEGFRLIGQSILSCSNEDQWNASLPQCIRTCPNLVDPPKGRIFPVTCATSPQLAWNKCSFECDSGYLLTGSQNVTCVNSGEWTDQPPVCLAQCPALSAPRNSDLTCTSNTEDSSCTMRCISGYKLKGSGYIICQEDGIWSEPLGTCEQTCPKIPAPADGTVEPPECALIEQGANDICRFSCLVSYGFSGSATRTCLNNGSWSGIPATCTSEKQYQIVLKTDTVHVCLNAESTLSSAPEKKSYLDCGKSSLSLWSIYQNRLLKNSGNGKCIGFSALSPFSKLVFMQCDVTDQKQLWSWPSTTADKHTLKLESESYYIWYGYSTAPEVVSTKKHSPLTNWLLYNPSSSSLTTFYGATNNDKCPLLVNVSNGNWNPSSCQTSATPGLQCNFVCATGYQILDGKFTATCSAGMWDGTIAPECIRSCTGYSSASIRNGSVTPGFCTSQAYISRGKICSFECDANFELFGERNTACIINGQWSSSRPVCQKRCPPPPVPIKGKIKSSTTCPTPAGLHDIGATCNVMCDRGYVANGTTSFTCLNTGSWDSPATSCIRSCHPPIAPTGGSVVCNPPMSIYPAGTTCNYACSGSRALVPSSSNETTCLSTGAWSALTPICQAFCSNLSAIANGRISPPECTGSTGLSNGKKCTYSCDPGYTLIGSRATVCLISGLWSGSTAKCEIDLHFFITHSDATSSICVVTVHYPQHNSYIVATESLGSCDQSSTLHKWSFTSANQIRNVQTGWCLGIDKKKNGQVIKLYDCDDSNENQQWECIIQKNVTGIRIKNTEYYLKSKFSYLYVKEKRNSIQFHPYGWESDAFAGNKGTVCGMRLSSAGTCPMLSITATTTVAPLRDCRSSVSIGKSCTLTCEGESELASGSTSSSITCLNYGVWDSMDIYCINRKCPSLTAPLRGSLSSSQCRSKVADWSMLICSVTCNTGFYKNLRDGETGTLKCLGNGVWNEPVPQCLSFCPQLAVPAQGKVNDPAKCTVPQGAKEGDVCIFACSTHYTLVGSSQLKCEASGAWSNSVPTCSMLTGSNFCPALSSPNFGNVNPVGCLSGRNPVNTECSVTCLDGYVAVAIQDMKSICQANGKWSSPLPNCKKVCTALSPPKFGSVTPNSCSTSNVKEGDKCTIGCDKTFSIRGNRVLTCLNTGQWDLPTPRCEQTSQFLISVGSECATATNAGDRIIAATCKFDDSLQRWEWISNRKIRNIQTQTCLAPETLSSYTPLQLVSCVNSNEWNCPYEPSDPTLQMLTYGNLHMAHSVNLDKSLFAVDISTELPEWVSHRSIDVSGLNETNAGTACSFRKRGICSPLVEISNGFPKSGCKNYNDDINVGDKCRYYCNTGYTMLGTVNRVCKKDGKWNDMTEVKCLATCPVLNQPEFSATTPPSCGKTNHYEDILCNFQCSPGYLFAGSSSRVCQSDGTWSAVPTICHTNCQPLTVVNPLTVSPSECSTTNQSMATLCTASCPSGYHLSGTRTRTCNYNGNWSGSENICKRSCAPLSSISNGRVLPADCVGAGKKAGDTCVFSCNNIYSLKGSRIQTCTEEGIWTGTAPTCLKTCRTLPKPSNGYIHCEQIKNVVGDVCTYYCSPDYVVNGISNKRTCLSTAQWDGSNIKCVRELQFMLFQSSPPDTLQCLYAKQDQSITMQGESLCNVQESRNRWAWHQGVLIRNAYFRKCLSGNILSAGSHLVLQSCNPNDANQKWECAEPERAWFIRLSMLKMYPLFSILSGTKVLLFDDDGLTFVQESNFGVTAHTQWYAKTSLSDRMTVCSAIEVDTCPPLHSTSGILISPSTCTIGYVPIGTNCFLSCPSSFKLNKPISSTTCTNSGQWSHEIPSCIAACPPFSLATGSDLTVSPPTCAGNTLQSSGFACRFACPPNSRLIGEPLSTCMSNSKWNNEVPTCKATCSSLNSFSRGIVTPATCINSAERLIEGTQCTYKCLQRELELSGVKTRTCTKSGKWSSPEPKCVKPCPAHLPPSGGTVKPLTCATTKLTVDAACVFACNPGLIQLGSKYRVCLANGSWSHTKPICLNSCPPIDPHPSVLVKPVHCVEKSQTPGDKCNLFCKPGFQIKGEEIIECLDTGKWSSKLAICIRRCPKLLKPSHGDAYPPACLGGDLYEGHECIFSCQTGYILKGTDVRVCEKDGSWSGASPTCQFACKSLGPQLNVVYEPKSCEYGYQTQGTLCRAYCSENTVTAEGRYYSAARCVQNGKWDSALLTGCFPTCSVPSLKNGKVVCQTKSINESFSYTAESICEIKCDDGYIPTGPSRSTCQVSANNTDKAVWIPPLSRCEYNPDPLIIINRIEFKSVCFGAEDEKLTLVEWPHCGKEELKTLWVWQDMHLIRNVFNGLCIDVSEPKVDVYVTLSACNKSNHLQHWECSSAFTYAVNLRSHDLSMSAANQFINGVVLAPGSAQSSRVYTYNPNTENEIGTLCSRRAAATCILPPLPLRAVVTDECREKLPSRPGQSCKVKCFSGSITILVCQENGQWLPPLKKICARKCRSSGILSSLAYFIEPECRESYVSASTFCTITCPAEYALVAKNLKIFCRPSGKWSRLDYHECKLACPVIDLVENGVLTPKLCLVNSCSLECSPGYRIHGPQTRQCLPTGRWSGTKFSCEAELQFSITSAIQYQQFKLCINEEHDHLVYKAYCRQNEKSQLWRWNSHFTIENVLSQRCLAVDFSKLSNDSSSIVRFKGQIPKRSKDGSLSLAVGSTKIVTVKCNSSDMSQRWTCGKLSDLHLQIIGQDIYLDIGALFRTSLDVSNETGSRFVNWVGTNYGSERSTCAFRNTGVCPSLSDIFGGTVSPPVCKTEFIVSGTRCKYSCQHDYTIEGDDVTICTESGKWSLAPPSCLGRRICSPLTPSEHLLVYPSLCLDAVVTEGHLCHMKCDDNSIISGTRSLLCGPDGQWNGTLPTCNVKCPALHPPNHGLLSPMRCEQGNIEPSFECSTSCDQGYTLVGNVTRTCLKDGSWRGAPAQCKKYCSVLPLIAGGTITPRNCLSIDTEHAKICKATCRQGFALRGETRIVCNDGVWSAKVPTCSSDWCKRINESSVSTNSIEYSGLNNGATVPNSVARISCRPGYSTKLSPDRVCLKNGEWSSASGSCEKTQCDFLPNLYHGNVTPSYCTSKLIGVPVGTNCYFACNKGYILVGPASKECQLGGKWSTSNNVECKDTHSKTYVLPFSMVFTNYNPEYAYSYCLSAEKETKLALLLYCARPAPYQIWRWFGSSRIQNVATQLCITLDSRKNNRRLILEVCSFQKPLQEIECADVESTTGKFRMKIGKYFIGYNKGTTQSDVIGWTWSSHIIDSEGLYFDRVSIAHFLPEWYLVPPCSFMCGGEFQTDEGDFSSPNYPSIYPRNVRCEWVIRNKSPKHELQIDFSRILLQKSNHSAASQSYCTEDYLSVSEGEDEEGNELKEVCWYSEPFRVISLLGVMRVIFFSNDNSNNAEGFSARWSSNPFPEVRSDCGGRNIDTPVILHSGSKPSGAPWQVFVKYKQGHMCNAFVISEYFVITSAHCVEKFYNQTGTENEHSILIIYKFTSQSDLIQRYQQKKFNNARKIWLHTLYKENSLTNDVALIMTIDRLKFGNNFEKICLANLKYGNVAVPATSLCWAIQWTKKMFSDIKSSWDFTRYSVVDLLGTEICKRKLRTVKPKEEFSNLLCAEEIRFKGVTREGLIPPNFIASDAERDEGSLLQCRWNNNWFVTGVHSFTLVQPTKTIFVFTNLRNYLPWINDVTTNAFYYLRENAIKK